MILEGGKEIDMRYNRFSPNGEWWACYEGDIDAMIWRKSAETRVAYIFPPAFVPPVDKPEDRVNFGGALGLKEEMGKLNPAPKPSLSVRLDNWLKKLLCRGA